MKSATVMCSSVDELTPELFNIDSNKDFMIFRYIYNN